MHRTQQFPGLDNPHAGPLPGDYRLRLASDEASAGLDGTDIVLIAAAAVITVLGFAALGTCFHLGRRRPQH